MANNVQMQDTVTTVHFIDVNSDTLKQAIIDHCSLWQKKLTGLLLHLTEEKLNYAYNYISENGKKYVDATLLFANVIDTIRFQLPSLSALKCGIICHDFFFKCKFIITE